MARRKLTELEINARLNQTFIVWRGISRILGGLIRYGCILGCVYYFSDAVKALSGKDTLVSFFSDIMINMKFDKWIGYIFGLGGIAYGAVKHWQVRNTRKTHSDHIKKLEEMVDPKRQGSQLDQYGEINDDDK